MKFFLAIVFVAILVEELTTAKPWRFFSKPTRTPLEDYRAMAKELYHSSGILPRTAQIKKETELQKFVTNNAAELIQEYRQNKFTGIPELENLVNNPEFAKLMAQDHAYQISPRQPEIAYSHEMAENRHNALNVNSASIIKQYLKIAGDLRRFPPSRREYQKAAYEMQALLEHRSARLFAEFKKDESAFLDALRDDYLLEDPLFSELLTRNGKRDGFHLWDPSMAIIIGGTWDVTDWRRFVALSRAAKTIDIFDASLSVDEWGFLRVAMERARRLEVLSFTRVKFGPGDLMKLSDIKVVDLQHLTLSGNDIGSTGLMALYSWLGVAARSAVSLTLSNNNLCDDGGNWLANMLSHLHFLGKLDLSRNGISAQGLTLMQPALSGMHNLETLNLYKNNLGKLGLRVISKILPALTNLKLLNISDNNLKARHVIRLMKEVVSLKLYNLRVVHGLKASDFDNEKLFMLKMEYWYVDFDKSPGSFRFDPDSVHEFERQSSISSDRL